MLRKLGTTVLFVMIFYFTAVLPFNSVEAAEWDHPVVVFETTQGEIRVQLFHEQAPKTVENMMGLIGKRYYDGIIFHRVIKGFMIQGGDPTGTGRGGVSFWGGKFQDEVTPELTFDKKGLLAMANAGPGTNGSQFFITTQATPWLNMKHTIFGEVIEGYDVVEKIENTKTGTGNRPVQEQKIIKAYVSSVGDSSQYKFIDAPEE